MMQKFFCKIVMLFLLPLGCLAESGTGVSLFTGCLSYIIPIYTIEDPDFHFDIALQYRAEGFKPFQPSGCYGQDWDLIAGGCISRSVQGMADEQKYENNDADSVLGMHRFLQLEQPDKYDVYNMTASVYDTCGVLYNTEHWLPCRHKVDYLPDVYYFNFCGYKGRFILNNHGGASIISGDYIKVDFTHFKDDSSLSGQTNSTPDANSYIKVQTLDGYTYIFGGTAYSIEYSTLTNRTNSIDQAKPAVSAWHLTQIIAPNGRKLVLSYSSGVGQSHNLNSLQSFITDYDWSEKEGETTHIKYSLHKECLLQSISTSDSVPLVVSFFSHVDPSPKYESTSFTQCPPHSLLDSVAVTYNNETLKTAGLSYQRRSTNMMFGAIPNYHWVYLRQVALSGVGKYTMTYNNISLNNYLSSYPALFPQTDAAYKNLVDRFGFWKATSLQGMMSEVSLPMGGKLKFTYGTHGFGEERRYCVVNTNNVCLNAITDEDQTIGGARIEKIESFSDENTLVDTKTYTYNKKSTNSSSGIFYNIYEVFDSFNSNNSHPIVNPNTYGMVDTHIGYSYVEQENTIGDDSYKTTYSFDTGETVYCSAGNSSIHKNLSVPGYNGTTEVRSGSLTFPDTLHMPGKLMAIEQYTGNTRSKCTLFQYNGIPNAHPGMTANQEPSLGCTDTVVVLSKYSAHTARKLYLFPNVLEKTVTYEYNGNDSMKWEKTYTHDRKFRKKKELSSDSRNRVLFTRYAYPDDFSFSVASMLPNDYPALYLMRKKYRINTPVEIVSGYMNGNTEMYTEGTINIYANGQYATLEYPGSGLREIPDPIIDPYFVLHAYPYLYKSLALALINPSSEYQYMAVNGNEITYDSRYRVVCEYEFNWYDRPLSVKPLGTTGTVYSWTKPGDFYPASKATGNQVYTYTYKPYVGLTSSTDPRGVTTYYTYDAAGRLIEEYQIMDGQKQILNVYQYHVKTE